MARGASSRVVAFLLMGLLHLPQAASLAGAFASAAGCACITRACCCPPASKPAPAPCHPREGGQASDPVAMRCHHPSLEATVPALPGLVSPQVSLVVHAAETPVPFVPSGTPRLGFGRIDSPPPRSSGNA